MTDKYDMSDKEKDELAQSMGFGSWDEYINLDTERVPEKETKTMLRDSSMSYVPDLTLSEEERYNLSLIQSHVEGIWEHGRGRGFWQTHPELLEDIVNFREESIGKGRFKNKPSWDYTTSKMNEKYGEDWATATVKMAYYQNKHLLNDEEV